MSPSTTAGPLPAERYNRGVLTVTNSTLYSNTTTATDGAALYNADSGTVTLVHAKLVDNPGGTIYNAGALTNAVTISATILSAPVPDTQCQGVTLSGVNLVHNAPCIAPSEPPVTTTLGLSPLRDNGGPTLTLAPVAGALVLDPSYSEELCSVATDQRGRVHPVAGSCPVGAVTDAPRTLTVCPACTTDLAALRFNDLQQALNHAMAGDTVALMAGAYTGHFIVYKDLTLQHAGIDVATLNREQPIDVRAILQADPRPVEAQYQEWLESKDKPALQSVLAIFGYAPTATTMTVTHDVNVTLRGLTIQQGMAAQGGGIYNWGNLQVFTSTIAGNAAINQYDQVDPPQVITKAMGGAIYNAGQLTLERSTISGNQSEYYGGALYNDGSVATAKINIVASTIVDNRAEPLPQPFTVEILGAPTHFSPDHLVVQSGDKIHFESDKGQPIALQGWDPQCKIDDKPNTVLEVPPMGVGLSVPLSCSTNELLTTTVRVRPSGPTLTITVTPPTFKPEGDAIYQTGSSQTDLAKSILLGRSTSSLCARYEQDVNAVINSAGYNFRSDNSCFESGGTNQPVTNNWKGDLGKLQDNNIIDFTRGWVSGYTYSHALLPGSSAIDQIPPADCQAAKTYTMTLPLTAEARNLSINAGDVIQWQNPYSATATVALHDGEATVQLVTAPRYTLTHELQFNTPGD
ncbi:MAG: hypothetical protein KDE58_42435, partial [Caldilineaceae bacterium]|nr:hypothetical protein [Caldilineaceae bacterium]